MRPARAATPLEPALNAATAGDGLAVEDYVALASRHGYRWIELNGSQMPGLRALGEDRAGGLLDRAGVAVSSFFLPVDWRRDDARFAADMQVFEDLVPFVARLGVTRCCTYLFPNVATPPAETRRIVGGRFRRVAALLGEYGLSFGLEFLGPAHFRGEPGHTFLYRMGDMLDFAVEIGANVGVLVDSLHWHCLGGDVEALAALPADRLIYAHIDDAPPGPVDLQRDDDRVLPGEGVIDLEGFLSGLRRAGYGGPVGIEVDGPYLRGETPDGAAARAFRSWRGLASRYPALVGAEATHA